MPDCTCQSCGKCFPVVESRVARTKFCSKECKGLARQNRVQTTCAFALCGKTFWDKASNPRKYCCREHFYEDVATPVKHLPLTELDKSQIEALVLQYERLVTKIAKKLYYQLTPRNLELDDFLQEGYIGLIEARQNYTGEESFVPLAWKHIYFAILELWRKRERPIRLAESLFRKDAKVTPEQLEQFKRNVTSISLEAAMRQRKERTSRRGQRGPVVSQLEEEMMRNERIAEMHKALSLLVPEQRQFVSEHFGLLSGEEVPMAQLAIKYKRPKVTTFRIVHRGIEHLKISLATEEGAQL